MEQQITRLKAKNFRSLGDVDVSLQPLSVLAGPNGSGKSNLLAILRFLAMASRFDIDFALENWGGMNSVLRAEPGADTLELTIEGRVTPFASDGALDSYRLRLTRGRQSRIVRTEELNFKRVSGPGRRIRIQDSAVTIENDNSTEKRRLASSQTSGLGTLARLGSEDIGPGPKAFFNLLASIRYIEPDVRAARQPSRIAQSTLANDAGNLADALLTLRDRSGEAFDMLVRDLGECLPGLRAVHLTPIGGPSSQVVVEIEESGLTRAIPLADASFGTVRLLALLVALHDPMPPAFTAIEEVDHGLHPYALDVLVDRMREASTRTQLLAVTHSPTLINRLRPEELILCDRDSETGESVIPARTTSELRKAQTASGYGLGELWFAGAIDGVPR